MNSAKDYNPCDHSVSAKVWECLRRNRSFRNAIESLRTGMCQPAKTAAAQRTLAHPVVAALWECAAKNNIAVNFEDSDWLSISSVLQQCLCALVERKHKATILDSAILADPSGMASLCKTHKIVAVPRLVTSQKDVRRVGDEVVREIEFRFRTQDFDRKGAAFGAPQQWRHFLLAERLSVLRGKLDEGGIKLASYLGDKPDRSASVVPSDRGKLLALFSSNLDFNEGRVENVRKDCKKIESRISSVFEDISVMSDIL